MAEVILMPRLSDTMTEGVIAAWHKQVGDTVKKGDLLAEIETDKATMELESYQNGTLLHIGAKDGEKLQVNDLLAIIGKQGEDVNKLIEQNKGGSEKSEVSNKKQEEEKPPVEKQKPEESQPSTVNDQQSTEKKQQLTDEIVLMPRLSDTMTEGVIASWNKNIGDDIKKGDILAEIETDKATMELESYKDGKLLYQGAKEGEKIAVNDLLAIIGKEGFDVEAAVKNIKSNKGTGVGTTTQDAQTREDKDKAEGDVAPPNAALEQDEVKAQKSEVRGGKLEPPKNGKPINEGRIFASPLAKKLAEEKGIDLRYVYGTGDNGRITKTDIENYKPAESREPSTVSSQQKTATQPINQSTNQPDFEDVPVSQMRKTIARRLAESKFSAPHFYLTMSIDMDEIVAARERMNEVSKIKISFNDIVLKAVAVALKQHPKVNSSWLGEKIRINHHVNIGVAVAVEEGLLVPVIRFADTKSLSQIAAEVKEYAQKAKDKKLQPSDWEGSTFTISNLGMFGIEEFTAIINSPDACILAIGGIAKIPVVKNNQIIGGNVMKLTLSCDHRVVDGATGAAFLQTLKSLLEAPLRMLI
ncbi:MAG: pyruvate dehydrogenase complex dihydrolipoamide acetyltransferase [Chitinophagaceae bacterium]